ncbi:fanconi-associated nuclease 1 [Marinobacter sp. JH2]|nr:VRR-NUC domain-containing protein [Marinobacter sp. JH2]QBM18627.1 fanconi-associated nuclease 1 [Marinobacter sp. JH2]
MRQVRSYPKTADLENPLYYLENMNTLVDWVAEHHGDLLTEGERAWLKNFRQLPIAARALLTRMIMRSGELFRVDKLNYPELPQPETEAVAELIAQQWLEPAPLLGLDDVFRLFTLAELRLKYADWLADKGWPKNLPKAQLREALADTEPEPNTVDQWFEQPAPQIVRVPGMDLFDRIRLMFFGNLRQSWTDFVLVELGVQQFETVPFTPESRAFQHRAEVDSYLQMHQCRERLDEGEPADDVWADIPDPVDNSWLTSRRNRLLLELGRQAERQSNPELALQAWAASGHREARLKQLRLLERLKRFEEAWVIAGQWQTGELSDAEVQGLERILKRLAPKMGEPKPQEPAKPLIRELIVTLPKPDTGSVEHAALAHLSTDEAPVFYVENTLINALFGLLCWPVIFKPIAGAFFHPFHAGPVDLTREDFVARRQADFDQCFAVLKTGTYREKILGTFRAKQGIANPFVVWPVVTEALLERALDCIPAEQLSALFQRLLTNVKEHRSGFPDLIRFIPDAKAPEHRYEMIEVKGPGDRLQDHQRRWLAFFDQQGIPASVCYVRWQEAEVSS